MEKKLRLEVLVATMHQNDFSLIKKMNIKSDVIFANQCDFNRYEELNFGENSAKLISTNTKGVGVNRNIALLYSSADILLFGDDDIVYNEDYAEAVEKAFVDQKDADAIIFGMDLIKDGKIICKIRNNNRRLHIWNALKYGTYVIAIKREVVIKHNFKFSEIFGGGCQYSCGEDSLFILDMLRCGAHVYTNKYVLGNTNKDSSTWFSGYNEKFFFDKGVWIACAFPHSKHIVKWYFILRFKKVAEISFTNTCKFVNRGIKAYKNLEKFER